MRFIDLFAGLGGFRLALEGLGLECVFASDIDEQMQAVYRRNFPNGPEIQGDIRTSKNNVPEHDVLCAGFPCQPFSKSGSQAGFRDETSGTLFHEILEIIETHKPKYVILENVGNFERHDNGRTWQIVRSSLEELGYDVEGTEHVTSGGHGLLSPHHLGYPHHRERFFAVASLVGVPEGVFPPRNRSAATSMADIIVKASELSAQDRTETRIVDKHVECIEHWNAFLATMPEDEVKTAVVPDMG